MGDQICRLCMKICDSNCTIPLQEIANMVAYCTSIKIDVNDGLPNNVCKTCNADAVMAYNFKKRCEESDKSFRSKDLKFAKYNSQVNSEELVKPETTNSKDSLKCKFCDKSFSYERSLHLHERKHETGLKCYICTKEFSTTRQLGNHISIHLRKGAHLCQTCGKQFTLPENLVRHQGIHLGLRPYECKICKKCFTQSGDLKSHMVTHSTEKLYLCNFCGNKFAREITLIEHIRRLHLNDGKSYTCTSCTRSFKDRKDLGNHMLIHSNQKKHVCKVCNKGFNRKCNLIVHQRIHSGLKPFECHICHRRFIQKHVLTTHLKTHPPS